MVQINRKDFLRVKSKFRPASNLHHLKTKPSSDGPIRSCNVAVESGNFCYDWPIWRMEPEGVHSHGRRQPCLLTKQSIDLERVVGVTVVAQSRWSLPIFQYQRTRVRIKPSTIFKKNIYLLWTVEKTKNLTGICKAFLFLVFILKPKRLRQVISQWL